MKSETCPHCGKKFDEVEIFKHLEEEHGLKPEKSDEK